MSTDDLTEALRIAGQARGFAEIQRDEARAEADRFRTLWDRHGKNDLLAERDAARAALGRVRALVETAELAAPADKPPYWTSRVRDALEGKPS